MTKMLKRLEPVYYLKVRPFNSTPLLQFDLLPSSRPGHTLSFTGVFKFWKVHMTAEVCIYIVFIFCLHQPKEKCFNGIYPIPQFGILLILKSGHTLSFTVMFKFKFCI